MYLFITSSPCIDGADQALFSNENHFVDRLLAVLPEEPAALFVCSDPDSHHFLCKIASEFAAAFAQIDRPLCRYDVLDGWNGEQAADLLYDKDIVILCGGHVPTQNAFFRDIDLDALLAEYEGVVLGISAGSMNMAREVYVQPEEAGESDPAFPRFAPGLGLTEVNILPHYQKVKDNILDGQRLFEDITYADSFGHTFFALPDGSYFCQDGETLLLCGESWIIRDGVLEHLTQPGQELDMAQMG